MWNFRILPLLVLLALPSTSPLMAQATTAEVVAGLSLDRPVVDEAKLLSPQAEQSLGSLLRQVQRDTGMQIGMVLLPDLGGDVIESVSIAIAEKWRLGTEAEDKGVLIVVARDERRVRIEVGQGLEGELTDAYSMRIIDQVISPAFRTGNFARGLEGAVAAILSYTHPDYKAPATMPRRSAATPEREPESVVFSLVKLLVFGALLLFLILTRTGRTLLFFLLIQGRAGGGGYRSGGGGGGGGGYGGGGGGFSGGGASGSW